METGELLTLAPYEKLPHRSFARFVLGDEACAESGDAIVGAHGGDGVLYEMLVENGVGIHLEEEVGVWKLLAYNLKAGIERTSFLAFNDTEVNDGGAVRSGTSGGSSVVGAVVGDNDHRIDGVALAEDTVHRQAD